MIEIKCLRDIQIINKTNLFSNEFIDEITTDLKIIKANTDFKEIYTLEEYSTEYFNCGHIIIFENKIVESDLEKLKVDKLIVKSLEFCVFDDERWVRIIIVDGCKAMIVWVKIYKIYLL